MWPQNPSSSCHLSGESQLELCNKVEKRAATHTAARPVRDDSGSSGSSDPENEQEERSKQRRKRSYIRATTNRLVRAVNKILTAIN